MPLHVDAHSEALHTSGAVSCTTGAFIASAELAGRSGAMIDAMRALIYGVSNLDLIIANYIIPPISLLIT